MPDPLHLQPAASAVVRTRGGEPDDAPADNAGTAGTDVQSWPGADQIYRLTRPQAHRAFKPEVSERRVHKPEFRPQRYATAAHSEHW